MTRHALVIGGDPRVEHLVEAHLWKAGFASVAHGWDEEDAWAALRNRRPSVIIVLADSCQAPEGDIVFRMSREADAPVLVATANRARAIECLGPAGSLEGPFAVEEMAEAFDHARKHPTECDPSVLLEG